MTLTSSNYAGKTIWLPRSFNSSCSYNKDLSSSHLYKNFQRKLLDNELKPKRTQHRILSRKLEFLKSNLQNHAPRLDFIHLLHLISNFNGKKINSVKLIHDRKIFNLGFRTNSSETKIDRTKCIFNFSSRRLTPDETEALQGRPHGRTRGYFTSYFCTCTTFLASYTYKSTCVCVQVRRLPTMLDFCTSYTCTTYKCTS